MKAFLLSYPLLVLGLFFPDCARSQTLYVVSGRITSMDGHALQNASVILKDSKTGNMITYSLSKPDGGFALKKAGIAEGSYLVTVEYINMTGVSREVQIKKDTPIIQGLFIQLQPSAKQMTDVVIKAPPLPFSIRGDTVEFKAMSYKTAETRKVEDLLRNMQGFELGSDGKISFNGKEVDRILIEGEDLTEKNYQLLSRNLNANLVDKVQVINNFSTERLLKEVEKSGKVGINLTIDEKFKNRISGGIEAGAGIGGREYLDNNLVSISRKVKLLSFLNYNETGMPSNTNVLYYFNEDEKVSSPVSGNQDSKGLLQTGIIYLPQLGQSYTRNNQDISGFAIGSWKAGEAVKMKALFGAGQSHLQSRAAGINQYLPADGNSWAVAQDEGYRSSLTESIFKFSLSHDRQKNNTGAITAEITGNVMTNKYANLSSGAIIDTLNEQLNGKGWQYHVSGNETFRLGEGRILKARFNLNHEDLSQDFQSRTNRYQGFFMLDSNFQYYRQKLNGILSKQEFDLSVYGRIGLVDWYTGFRMVSEKTAYYGESKSVDPETTTTVILGQEPSKFLSFRSSMYGMMSRQVKKKGQLSTGMSLGAGKARFNQDISTYQKTAPILRYFLGYKHAFSTVKNISLQYAFSSQLADRLYFHPPLLLSGQATILYPAEQLVNQRNHLFSFTYATHNLLKGTGLVFFTSYSHTDGAYSYSTNRTPEYSLLYYLSQNGNKLWTANLKLDKYVIRIKTKFSVQLSSVYTATTLIFNEIVSTNKMHNFSIQPKAVTAFTFPVNLEGSFTSMYVLNSTIPETGETSLFDLWQYQGYGKLKVRAGKKLYMAAIYNYYVLAPENFFQTMDLYTNITVNKAWVFSLTVHNLFNASTIGQRQFGVNTISQQRYDLVGRYLMIKAQWTF